MLRDSGLGQFQTLPDLLDVTTLGKEPGDYLQTDGMPEDFKDFRLTFEIDVLVEFLLRHSLLLLAKDKISCSNLILIYG
jgi:hypothetical protein